MSSNDSDSAFLLQLLCRAIFAFVLGLALGPGEFHLFVVLTVIVGFAVVVATTVAVFGFPLLSATFAISLLVLGVLSLFFIVTGVLVPKFANQIFPTRAARSRLFFLTGMFMVIAGSPGADGRDSNSNVR